MICFPRRTDERDERCEMPARASRNRSLTGIRNPVAVHHTGSPGIVLRSSLSLTAIVRILWTRFRSVFMFRIRLRLIDRPRFGTLLSPRFLTASHDGTA